MRRNGFLSIVVAGMLDYSLALRTSYAHVDRYACIIPGTQDEPLDFSVTWSPARFISGRVIWRSLAPAARLARKNSSLGFAAKYAAQLMDEILTPVPIEPQLKSS